MSKWHSTTLSEIAFFNPRESIQKGEMAVKVGMDKLQPFCRDIPEIEYEEFSGGTKFRNGDTIMARITPCLENGKTAMVNVLQEGEVGFGSTEYIVLRAKPGISDPYFVYYLACSSFVREPAIKSMVGSSGRQRVQTDVLQALEILVPDYLEQVKIGNFLKKIDDKIAVNNSINKNLSEQLAAIFDEACQHADTEITLSDLCELTSSKRVFAKDYKEAGVPFYRGKEISLRSNGSPLTDLLYISEEQYQEIKDRYGVPKKGDILLTAVGTIGNSFMVEDDVFYFKDGNIIWLKDFKSAEINYFVYDYMKSRLFKHDVDAITIGSTQQALTIVALSKVKICIPPKEELVSYFEKSKAYHETIINNQKENRALTSLRDSLLQKLMSGELDVSELEL